MNDWKQDRQQKEDKKRGGQETGSGNFIGGADFDAQLDEMAFNRVIRFKNLDKTPQGNADIGKVYWNNEEGKLKMWVGEPAKWADLVFTTTSTSTTSSSTSSTSTS